MHELGGEKEAKKDTQRRGKRVIAALLCVRKFSLFKWILKALVRYEGKAWTRRRGVWMKMKGRTGYSGVGNPSSCVCILKRGRKSKTISGYALRIIKC